MAAIDLLTEHQRERCLDILDKVVNEKVSVLLEGSAGTGKTFTADAICNSLLDMGIRNVYVSAPTHTAVDVLKSKIRKSTSSKGIIQFGTIHSYLKLQKKIVDSKEMFLPSGARMQHADVLLLDEVSMISNWMLKLLKEKINYPIIFIGDIKQLPPIGEEFSPVFELGLDTFKLTEPRRQKNGSDLITLANNLDLLKDDIDGKDYGFFNNFDDLLPTLSEGTLFLTWTRKRVKEVNNLVREYIFENSEDFDFDKELPQYIKGETITFIKPYKGYKNNERIQIKHITTIEKKFLGTPIKLWKINHSIEVLHEETEYLFKKLADSYKKRSEWKNYYNFLDKVAHVRHNHATTVHKSQGQTFDKIITDYNEIKRNPNKKELRKMLYTSVTRAAKNVYILKEV